MVGIRNSVHVMIYKDPARYCCEVGVKELKNGDVLTVFGENRGLAHWDTGSCVVVRSRDGGRTWDPSSRVVVWHYTENMGVSANKAITQLSNGTVIINCGTRAFLKALWPDPQLFPEGSKVGKPERYSEVEGVYLIKSGEEGYTWGDPIKVNIAPMRYAAVEGPVVELPDGALLMPLEGRMFSRNRTPSLGDPSRCFLVRSEDEGENWEYYSTIAYDPASIINYHEPSMVRTKDGRLICMMRTHLEPSLRHGNLYVSVSENGVTWDASNEFFIRRGGIGPKNLEHYYHIGYPKAEQLRDGRILTAYHLFSDDDPPVQYVVGTIYELDG